MTGWRPSTSRHARRCSSVRSRVRVVGGRGEAIPLRSGAVPAAWLSLVLHHLDDPGACASELHRVLCDHGRVLLRGAFPDAGAPVDLAFMLEFFPAAEDPANPAGPIFGQIPLVVFAR